MFSRYPSKLSYGFRKSELRLAPWLVVIRPSVVEGLWNDDERVAEVFLLGEFSIQASKRIVVVVGKMKEANSFKHASTTRGPRRSASVSSRFALRKNSLDIFIIIA